jgi:hypothetical protein
MRSDTYLWFPARDDSSVGFQLKADPFHTVYSVRFEILTAENMTVTLFWGTWKIEAAGCFETLEPFYLTKWRHISDDSNLDSIPKSSSICDITPCGPLKVNRHVAFTFMVEK